MLMVQADAAPAAAQAPVQPARIEPGEAVAVSVTRDPRDSRWRQSVTQAIPRTSLTTPPRAVWSIATVSVAGDPRPVAAPGAARGRVVRDGRRGGRGRRAAGCVEPRPPVVAGVGHVQGAAVGGDRHACRLDHLAVARAFAGDAFPGTAGGAAQ